MTGFLSKPVIFFLSIQFRHFVSPSIFMENRRKSQCKLGDTIETHTILPNPYKFGVVSNTVVSCPSPQINLLCKKDIRVENAFDTINTTMSIKPSEKIS